MGVLTFVSVFQDIPKAAVLKYLLRCSVCDFVTKVRLNLIKHLKLHVKTTKENNNKDTCYETTCYVPFITPINQPESEDGSLGFAKMSSLLVRKIMLRKFIFLNFML